MRGSSEAVVFDDGARVAWRVGFDVQVAYLGSGDIVSLQDGFRFCAEMPDDCLFNSSRFVTNKALKMSGDGSALTIFLILEEDVSDPQGDTNELLQFNLDTGVLSRVSPNDDNFFTASSDDGNSTATRGFDDQGRETVIVLRASN